VFIVIWMIVDVTLSLSLKCSLWFTLKIHDNFESHSTVFILSGVMVLIFVAFYSQLLYLCFI